MRQTSLVLLALAVLVLGGCAGSRMRVVDLTYTPPSRPSASGTASPVKSVAVASFVDARDRTDRIGLQTGSAGPVVFTVRGSLPEAVTEAIVRQLEADGYRVTRLGRSWDPRSGRVPGAEADAVVGGVIESFYGETNGDYVWSPVEALVRLRIAVASPEQDRIVGESVIRGDLSGTITSRSLEGNLKERFQAVIAQVPLVRGLEPSIAGTR